VFQSGSVRFPDSVRPLMVPMDSITQFTDNPNNGDLDALIESITVNGFQSIITVDAKTRQIIAGNHRWQALHAMGATECPVVFAEYEEYNQARRYMIADNRTGRLAVMDDEMLIEHLNILKETEVGLFGTGFTEDEVMNLLMTSSEPPPLEGGGFGQGVAPNGIYEATVTFEDEAARNEAYEHLVEMYGHDNVRTMNL